MLRWRACNIALILIAAGVSVVLLEVLCWVRFVCGTLDNTEIAVAVSVLILPVGALDLLVYYLSYHVVYFGRKAVGLLSHIAFTLLGVGCVCLLYFVAGCRPGHGDRDDLTLS